MESWWGCFGEFLAGFILQTLYGNRGVMFSAPDATLGIMISATPCVFRI
jgi:hypothetical protein